MDKRIKTNVMIIILLVAILSLSVIKISYSYFSQVQKSNIYGINTGDLNVYAYVDKNKSDVIYLTNVIDLPSKENIIMLDTYSSLDIYNNGTIDAYYKIKLKASEETKSIDFNYIYFGLYDENKNEWVRFNDNYYLKLDNEYKNDDYEIFEEELNSKSYKKYRVYFWVSDEISNEDIGKMLDFDINIVSNVKN